MSNKIYLKAKPDYWLLGDPAYIRNDGYWEFFGRTPTHVGEFVAYREEVMLDSSVSIEIIELVGDIIDSVLITKMALRKCTRTTAS